MKIEVFGTGCTMCDTLAANVKEAAERLKLDVELIRVKDLREIAARGVMVTPTLMVDGQLRVCGNVLSVDEIENLLNDSAAQSVFTLGGGRSGFPRTSG